MNKIHNAKLEYDSYRKLMHEAKTAKEHAEYKRDFIKARNRHYELMLGFKNSVRGK